MRRGEKEIKKEGGGMRGEEGAKKKTSQETVIKGERPGHQH